MSLFKHIGENRFKLAETDNPNRLSKADELRGVEYIVKKIIPYIAKTDPRSLGNFTEADLIQTLRKVSDFRHKDDDTLDYVDYKAQAKSSKLYTGNPLTFVFEIYKILVGGKQEIRVAAGYAHRDMLDMTFKIDDDSATPF